MTNMQLKRLLFQIKNHKSNLKIEIINNKQDENIDSNDVLISRKLSNLEQNITKFKNNNKKAFEKYKNKFKLSVDKYNDNKFLISNIRKQSVSSIPQKLKITIPNRKIAAIDLYTNTTKPIASFFEFEIKNPLRPYTSAYFPVLKEYLKLIQNYRKCRKQIIATTHIFQSKTSPNPIPFPYQKTGGVHTKPNQIIYLYEMKMSNSVYDPKKPTKNIPYVGIELEFLSKSTDKTIGRSLIAAGLAKYCELKHDGSLRTDENFPYSHELCILVEESDYVDVVNRICKVLKLAKCSVNKSCGMHVHIDCRNRDFTTIHANLIKSQNILYAMNPPARLKGTYSRKNTTTEWKDDTSVDNQRYLGVNGPQAFKRHQTIEVRMHSGTTDATKIINWVKLLLLIANKKEQISRTPKSLAFFTFFEVPDDLANYVIERILKFQNVTDNFTETEIEIEAA